MIEVRNIVKRFGQVEVLKGINLDIARGGVTSIVGPSGAGKTTLLQIIGSLTSPDAGSVSYDGTDIFRLKDNALSRFRNRNIGFVFQFHQLLPEFNMIENVAMPAIIAGCRRKEAFDRAAKLIDYLGLKTRMTHRPGELSGGECQRAAVARALINDPKVVLADEPTGSLDSHNRAELHRLFFDLRRDLGATFIIVTHDENLAADCDRIIKMQDGHVDEIIDKPTEPTDAADSDIAPVPTDDVADPEPDIIIPNNPD
jgi:lipoprotein-releasing system ATP-binding protein